MTRNTSNETSADRADLILALEEAAQPCFVTLEGDVRELKDGIELCGVAVRGASLRAHLAGCERALLFAATLGVQVDRLISRRAVLSVADAYLLDTLASEAIERYCDEVQEALSDRSDGLYLRPRYSPGYGDVPMETSFALLNALHAGKRIGLCATARGMLTPVKSVTAFIGLTREKQSCHIHKCAACPNTGCAFRKEA
ncbi:MAG: Vitamin B12 dependent methionine synthase activation subunit [Eubacteriales bacterium]|nr:Vitamin B12 dependent methionine synthase activation subunit [Eubacteriales bacterium]